MWAITLPFVAGGRRGGRAHRLSIPGQMLSGPLVLLGELTITQDRGPA